MMKLTANIESFEDNKYVAFIDSIKGMVVQGDSLQDVCKELMISLKVKIAYDYGVDIRDIKHKEFQNEKDFEEFVNKIKMDGGKAEKEISLDLSLC